MQQALVVFLVDPLFRTFAEQEQLMGLDQVADHFCFGIDPVIRIDDGADIGIQGSGVGGNDAHIPAHDFHIGKGAVEGAVFI